MHTHSPSAKDEWLHTAARLIVEEGVDYGTAKRRAAEELGLSPRSAQADNLALEDAVRAYLRLFCGDTQPQELRALRKQALVWMDLLSGTTAAESSTHKTYAPHPHYPPQPEDFRPHLSGAVWRGTATRLNDIYIALFCDDTKAAEIALINWGISYDVGDTTGMLKSHSKQSQKRLPILAFSEHNVDLNEPIGVLLTIYDHDDLRGLLRPDAHGMCMCGNRNSVRAQLEQNDDIQETP